MSTEKADGAPDDSFPRISHPPSQRHRQELALLEAAEYGQYQRAKRFLDAGHVDVDFVDDTGRSALHFAAKYGHLDIIRELVRAGCDVDASSKTYGTALCLAASMKHVAIVHALLEAGADVKAPGGGLGSALHAACCCGSVELVDLFLKHGVAADVVRIVDVQIMRDKHGKPVIALPKEREYHYSEQQPLHIAAAWGRVDVVEKLLSVGVDINARKKVWYPPQAFGTFAETEAKWKHEGTTALHDACRQGRIRMIELLLNRGANPNAEPSTETRGRPLVDAAMNGNPQCIHALLDAGAEVDARSSKKTTALFNAVMQSKLEGAKALLDRGADVNAKANGGFTPIFYPTDPAMVELLLNWGASFEVSPAKKNGIDITPLKFVSSWQENSTKVIEKMVELGADVNDNSKKGVTPLYCAVLKKRKENALTLLRLGADPSNLSSDFRKELEKLVGEVPESSKKFQKSIAKEKKPLGLFQRLVSRQRAQSSSQREATTKPRPPQDDDDEKTLYGDSRSVICKG